MINTIEEFYGKTPLTDGISPVQNTAERPVSGYGYVILSREASRANYIENCLRNNIITIITDKNEVIRNCSVTEDAWNYIKFPKTIRSKGSCVIWKCPPRTNRTTVIATVTKRDELQAVRRENTFRMCRESELGTILIEGNVDKGTLNFFVDSDIENGAQVSLRILNTLIEGLLDIYIQGSLKIEVDDSLKIKIKNTLKTEFIDEFNPTVKTTFNYTLSEGYTMEDEFGNQIIVNQDGISATVPEGKKIILQGATANQNAVLGQNLVSLIQELIGKINQLTVMTPSGQSSVPLNILDFTLISQKASVILSQINFLS